MPNEICVFNRQNVRNDLCLKPSMKTKCLRLSEHNFQFIFLVLRALQAMIRACIDSLVHACLTLCNFDNIMHAINQTLISIIIFWDKPKVFVEINCPLSSVNF